MSSLLSQGSEEWYFPFRPPFRRESFQLVDDHLVDLYPREVKALRSWIQTCHNKHQRCAKQNIRGTKFYPTRLIDLRSSTIRLIEGHTLKSSDGDYVALSYCWGKSMPETGRTTRETFKARQTSIQYEQLPKTLREAILVTRSLGMPFIWIDCLCIIQGDADDWEKESVTMGQVYSQAVVTIAAGVSDHCDGGFLQPKWGWFRDNLVNWHQSLQEKDLRSFRSNYKDNILSERGWTFQERELSTRIIHFTPRWIVGQCREHLFCYHIKSRKRPRRQDVLSHPDILFPQEYLRCLDVERDTSQDAHNSNPIGIDTSPNAHGTEPTGFETGPIPRNLNYRLVGIGQAPSLNSNKAWRQLARDYSARTFTKPSDKLAALSGLVEVMRPIIRSEYLAGLWRNELRIDLLWSRMDEEGQYRHEPYSTYYAPSWSWLSGNFSVGYQGLGLTVVPPSASPRDQTEIIEARIVSPKPSVIREGYIRLRAQIKPILDTGFETFAFYFDDGVKPWNATTRLAQEVESGTGSDCFICRIAYHTKNVRSHGTGFWAAGLILQRQSRRRLHYKRVGMVTNIPLQWLSGIGYSEIVIL